MQYQLLKARLSSHPWAWRDDKKQKKNKEEEGEKVAKEGKEETESQLFSISGQHVQKDHEVR